MAQQWQMHPSPITKNQGDNEENFEDSGKEEAVSSQAQDSNVQSQVSVEEREQIISKNKTKLEKLLAQPDIFDCLRRINQGEIQNYDELDHHLGQANGQAADHLDNQSRRRNAIKAQEELDELNDNNNSPNFEIRKLEKQPDNLVGGTLRDYQIEGLNWLYKLCQANLNGILADEMGLGKTIQSIAIIALIESLKSKEEIQNRDSHHIIIVPKIVLGKWRKEILEWFPEVRLLYFYGNGEERDQQRAEIRSHQYDLILTTFETAIKEKNELRRLNIDFLILDEAQRIKNDQSVLSQALRKFKTKHRILLTGTPLQNNLKELWALLNFLMPKLFDSSDEFKELFMVKNDDQGSQEYIVKQIHRLLRPFMLRRLKVDVEKNLAPKKEIYLFMGLSKLQKQLYKNILSGSIDVVNGIGGDRIKLLNVLMQLKKVCNHPYLFDKVEPGPPFVEGEHLVDAGMKFKVLDSLIPRLLKENCKILIFSQMTRLLDILDDFLRFRGYKYCRIDGQTSANDRELRIEDFQNPESDKQLFILSTRAGGLGINLHAANIVIIFDSDWNPQVDLQAIDRAHRIGQKREVIVYRFVTEGSVEEKIVERAARKLKVDHLIMQKGKFNHQQQENPNKINAQDMMQMIRYGAQEIILTEQEGSNMQTNIESIIDHSLKKTEEINKELNQIEDKFNLNNVSLTGEDEKQTDLYMFEGQDYKKKQPVINNEMELIDIGQRERKQLSYDIDKYYREALNINPAQTKEKKKLKGWKAQANGGYDHQFFDNAKLDALEEKESNWNAYQTNQEEYLDRKNMKPPIFTKKDQDLKDRLLKQGFSNWSKKDFFYYIRMCEAYGRGNIQKITEQFPTKTLEEVKEFSTALWKSWDKIDNGQKYVERIEKGEQEINKLRQIDEAIEDKFNILVESFLENNPDKDQTHFTLDDVVVLKGAQKGQAVNGNLFDFSDEEDRFLAYSLYKYGYGYWEIIRNELRNSQRFMFNWVVKCRSIQDIQKRCEFLVSCFKREVQAVKKRLEEEKAQQEAQAAAAAAKVKAKANNSKNIQSKKQGKGVVSKKRQRGAKSAQSQQDLDESVDSNEVEEDSVQAASAESMSEGSQYNSKSNKKKKSSAPATANKSKNGQSKQSNKRAVKSADKKSRQTPKEPQSAKKKGSNSPKQTRTSQRSKK